MPLYGKKLLSSVKKIPTLKKMSSFLLTEEGHNDMPPLESSLGCCCINDFVHLVQRADCSDIFKMKRTNQGLENVLLKIPDFLFYADERKYNTH